MNFSRFFIAALFAGCSFPQLHNFEEANSVNEASQSILMPDGKYLTPAGTSITLNEFPTGMAISPDKKNAVVVNSGVGQHTLSIINITKRAVVQTLPIKNAWLGVVWAPLGDYFFVTGGNDNTVYRYGFKNDSAWFLSTIRLGKPAPSEYISPAGLAINNEGSVLYTVSRMSNTIFKLNAYDNTIISTLGYGSSLYGCVYDDVRNRLYVSAWEADKVLIIDAFTFKLISQVSVGKLPTDMLMDNESTRLFVTNSGENTITIIDLNDLNTAQMINVAPLATTLIGSTPNALALSDDGSILFVANADNNAIALLTKERDGLFQVKGFIPTGWYPTTIRLVDSLLLVANGKGEQSFPNSGGEHIAELQRGTLSFISFPDSSQVVKYTSQVYYNNARNPSPGSDLPIVPPVKHVFVIVKENRTYDDIFGDIPKGRGDSSLTKFGRDVTPNHHALAESFILFDNYFSVGESNADGLHWLLGGYANVYTERTWPILYSRRGGSNNYEQDGIAFPITGFVWDAFMSHGLSVRNYGLFLSEEESMQGNIVPTSSSLAPVTSLRYRGWDMNYFDTSRARIWKEEFQSYALGDSFSALQLIRIPNDHTAGFARGRRTQQAMVADNDLALGMIVQTISESSIWKESVIFVVESNPQGGNDHVDAHRSILLAIGPYVKRNSVDHTHYNSLSVLRTIVDLFGIAPMTQHVASTKALHSIFNETPEFTPYQAKIPRVNFYTIN